MRTSRVARGALRPGSMTPSVFGTLNVCTAGQRSGSRGGGSGPPPAAASSAAAMAATSAAMTGACSAYVSYAGAAGVPLRLRFGRPAAEAGGWYSSSLSASVADKKYTESASVSGVRRFRPPASVLLPSDSPAASADSGSPAGAASSSPSGTLPQSAGALEVRTRGGLAAARAPPPRFLPTRVRSSAAATGPPSPEQLCVAKRANGRRTPLRLAASGGREAEKAAASVALARGAAQDAKLRRDFEAASPTAPAAAGEAPSCWPPRPAPACIGPRSRGCSSSTGGRSESAASVLAPGGASEASRVFSASSGRGVGGGTARAALLRFAGAAPDPVAASASAGC